MATIKIYTSKISRDRNARVDAIQSYLTSLTPVYTCNEFQYIKLDLNLSIKLVLDQSKVGKAVGNYVDLYQDEKHFYFFIDKANWKSTNTVELILTLDTVNTFADDFTFNKKTTIHRQHKDRGEIKTVRGLLMLNGDSNFVDGFEYRLNPNYDGGNNVFYYDWETYYQDKEMTLVKYGPNNEILDSYQGIFYFRVTHNEFVVSDDHDTEIFAISVEDVNDDAQNGIYWMLFANAPYELHEGEEELYALLDSKRTSDGDFFKLNPDVYPEGINPVQYNSERDRIKILEENNINDLKWYLYYENHEQLDPEHPDGVAVDLFLYPSDSITANVISDTFSLLPSDLTDDKYYHMVPMRNYNFIVFGGLEEDYLVYDENNKEVGAVLGYRAGRGWTNYMSRGVVFHKVDSTHIEIIQLNTGFIWKNDDFGPIIKSFSPGKKYVVEELKFKLKSGTIVNPSYLPVKIANTIKFGSELLTIETTLISKPTTGTPFSINALPDNRSDVKLIKCVELPYAPSGIEYLDDGTVNVDGTYWNYDATKHCLQLVFGGVGKNKLQYLTTEINSDYNPLKELFVNIDRLPLLSDLRDDKYEGKLKSSEFYLPKLVYDSSELGLGLEKINLDDTDYSTQFKIDYQVSRNMASSFLFGLPDINYKYSTSTYPNTMVCNRNNEVMVFTSAYLDYINGGGYNYDKKAKELSLIRSGTDMLLSTAGGIISGAATGALFGSGAGPAGIIAGAAIGVVRGIANTIYTQIQQENQIERKLEELQNSKVTVSGADDLDMLNYYCGNRAMWIITKCSDRIREMAADLFYYCGYADNIQKIPNTNSRMWFNFIQCDAVFNEEATTPYRDYLEDLKQRYQEGVTVYHRNEGSGYIYDWGQQLENWERKLFTPIN